MRYQDQVQATSRGKYVSLNSLLAQMKEKKNSWVCMYGTGRLYMHTHIKTLRKMS